MLQLTEDDNRKAQDYIKLNPDTTHATAVSSVAVFGKKRSAEMDEEGLAESLAELCAARQRCEAAGHQEVYGANCCVCCDARNQIHRVMLEAKRAIRGACHKAGHPKASDKTCICGMEAKNAEVPDGD